MPLLSHLQSAPWSHNGRRRVRHTAVSGSVEKAPAEFPDTSLDKKMSRRDYMVELVVPSAGKLAQRSPERSAAQRRLIQQAFRQFKIELRTLRSRDPDITVRGRSRTLFPLFIVNTLPTLRHAVGKLSGVRSVDEAPHFRPVR